MSHALLDADIIAYRVAAKNQYNFGDDEIAADENKAVEDALSLVADWTATARCSKPILCFSDRDGNNFRKVVAADYAKASGRDPYKANRPPKPLAYWHVVEALEERFKVVRFPFLEADDVMAILAGDRRFHAPVIVSIDKDMLSVPGRVLNPDKAKRPVKISERQANRTWLIQALTGDTVDGYKGCPRVGAKTAEKLLDGVGSLREAWKIMVEAFEAKKQTEEDAIYNARMARILRASDYVNGEILLWHPRKSQQTPLRF